MRRWWKSSDICESQRSLEGIFAACYALGPLKVSWAPLHMFWDGCVFEVAVAAGISLTDWRLSRFWQLSHFSFTVIHHRITIRRARTHCRWGKKGSSGKGRRRLSSGRSTSGAETLVRSHPVRGGALRVFFFLINSPLEIMLRLIRLSKRLSCWRDPTPFGIATLKPCGRCWEWQISPQAPCNSLETNAYVLPKVQGALLLGR